MSNNRIPKHQNPDRVREYTKKRGNRILEQKEHWAHAPYNFIPLPDKMISANDPLDHDRYHAQSHTGWIDLEIETCSPTFIRGMLTEAEFREHGRKNAADLTKEEKEARADFFSTTEAEVGGEQVADKLRLTPAIPGSSLRGLVRNLVEIIGHGRMQWVAQQPTMTYRAVAAQGEDPFKAPYQKVMGTFNNKKVRAGYLIKDGDSWSIQPAMTTRNISWGKDDEPYIKIDDADIRASRLPNYLDLNHNNYRPQIHQIHFEQGPLVKKERPKRGSNPKRQSIKVTNRNGILPNEGVLVCSGNMSETGGRSPRKKQAIILPADPNRPPIPISKAAVEAYIKGLSTYVADKENLQDWNGGNGNQGCLGDGKPVFFIPEQKEILYFGHNPNFRLPMFLRGSREIKAATPHDFVPDPVRDNPIPDLAEAIFGWVQSEDGYGPEEEARAGRVFFEDGHFKQAKEGVWYSDNYITPKILASPKPTTFQHYLVQDGNRGHDPDEKMDLAHYGTNPKNTSIRGYKHYWHQGRDPDIKFDRKAKNADKRETQLSKIIPLKPGVSFTSRIYFENLRPEELGALLWVINLPHTEKSTYCQKLGMGKPLGMGAIQTKGTVTLSDRLGRYKKLFDQGSWFTPSTPTDNDFAAEFEQFILDRLEDPPAAFNQIDRIKQLLTMLAWRGDDESGKTDPIWKDWTRYMEIEHRTRGNEYVERPVLPIPTGVIDQLRFGKIDDQPFSISEEKERLAQIDRENQGPKRRELEIGQRIIATVGYVDKSTTQLLVNNIDGLPDPKEEIDVVFKIAKEFLDVKNYQEGQMASVIVVEIIKDDFEWVIDCKPANI